MSVGRVQIVPLIAWALIAMGFGHFALDAYRQARCDRAAGASWARAVLLISKQNSDVGLLVLGVSYALLSGLSAAHRGWAWLAVPLIPVSAWYVTGTPGYPRSGDGRRRDRSRPDRF
jgi:hypothetical protein